MSAPETEEGRARKRILARLQALAKRDPEYKVGVAAGVWLDDLDAIEAEARQSALAEAIRRVEGLPYSARWTNSPDEYVSESAVLSILRDLASRDTGATTGGLPPADPRLAGTEYGPV